MLLPGLVRRFRSISSFGPELAVKRPTVGYDDSVSETLTATEYHAQLFLGDHFVIVGQGVTWDEPRWVMYNPYMDGPYFEMLFPVVFLIAAGYLVIRYIGPIRQRATAALTGASVMTGYLTAVLVTALTVSTERTTEGGRAVVYEPLFMETIIVAGILYPVVFGALGGLLATTQLLRTSSE